MTIVRGGLNVGTRESARRLRFEQKGALTATDVQNAIELAGVVANVRMFGAKGDGVTDDQPAFQRAIDWVRDGNGWCILVPNPPVEYLLNSALDGGTSEDTDLICLVGESQFSTVIRPNFAGAALSALTFGDRDGDVSAPTVEMHNLWFRHKSQLVRHSKFFDLYKGGQHRFDNVRFGGANNTLMRLTSCQNVAMEGVMHFGPSEMQWVYKSSDGITFSASGTTITSSAAFFDAGMVDRIFWYYKTSGTFRDSRLLITGVTDSTHATVDFAPGDSSGIAGQVEPAWLSMSMGSDVATADCNCFSVGDVVGRRIVIIDGQADNKKKHATIIAKLADNQVQLDFTAAIAITDKLFASPAIEIDGEADTSVDVRIDQLHMKDFSGLALAIQDAGQVRITNPKIEGNIGATSLQGAAGHVWLDKVTGVMDGDLSGQTQGPFRFDISGQATPFVIRDMTARRGNREPVFKVREFADPNGCLCLGHLSRLEVGTPSADYAVFVDDNSTPKFLHFGFDGTSINTEDTRLLLGSRNVFVDAATEKLTTRTIETKIGSPPAVTFSSNYDDHKLRSDSNAGFAIGIPAANSGGYVVSSPDHNVHAGWVFDLNNARSQLFHAGVEFLRVDSASVALRTDIGRDLGSASFRWKDVYSQRVRTTRVITGEGAPASYATTGDQTYTAANVLSGAIIRDCAGSGRTDTFPTAALLVAAITDAAVGDIIRCYIVNGSDAAETITLAEGAGGGWDANQTAASRVIPQFASKLVHIRLTNVTALSEAYVMWA